MRISALMLLILLGAIPMVQANENFRASNIIYQEKSLYRNIVVAEGEGHRCMKFGRLHARQSCIMLSDPNRLVLNYSHGMLASFFAIANPQRVLVIGLGGGVLPNALHNLDPSLDIDAVEIDPAVVRVARSHFGYVTDAKSKVYENDARVFIRSQGRLGEKYDLIFIDAFDKDYIPEHLLTVEFLKQVRYLLRPGGLVASNTFAAGALAGSEAATYQAVFGELMNINLPGGNRIILSSRDGLPDYKTIAERASKFEERFARIGMDSNDLLQRFSVQPLVTDARVLTDQYSPSNLLMQYSPVEWYRRTH